jgi:hypothetical protein
MAPKTPKVPSDSPKRSSNAKGSSFLSEGQENKGGRPSKFGTLDLAQVEFVARKGWTDEEMAKFFGVAVSTWYLWKVEHAEFSDALKDWKTEADARVERSLYERALGYEHPSEKIFQHDGQPVIVPFQEKYPPDTTACIFWLKNRQSDHWRDKQELDINHRLAAMTDQEIEDELAQLTRRS